MSVVSVVGAATLLSVAQISFPVPASASEPSNEIVWSIAEPFASAKEYAMSPVLDGDARHKGIDLRGCRGESVSTRVLLGIKKGQGVAISLVATDVTGEQRRIPASAVDVRVIKTWFQAESAGKYFKRWRPYGRTLVSELLLKDSTLVKVDTEKGKNFIRLGTGAESRYEDISDSSVFRPKASILRLGDFPVEDSRTLVPIDIRTNETQQFWVKLGIPSDAASGNYAGALNILSGERMIASIPLNLMVSSFELAAAPLEYSIYYRGVLEKEGTISSEKKNEVQYRAEMRNLLEHGVSSPTLYQPIDDVAMLRRALEIRLEERISGEHLYYLGIKTEDLTRAAIPGYAKQVRGIQSIAGKFGIRDVFVYGIDEAPKDIVRNQIPAWAAVKRAGGAVFTAGWTTGYGPLIGGEVNVFVSGAKPLETEIAAFHERGTRVFLYNQPQSGVEDPETYRKNYGFALWRFGYDGAMIYAYQHGFGSVWDDFDHAEYRDHNFTYPTLTGVIDTIEWEGFAAGITDVRYLASLLKALKEAERAQSGQTEPNAGIGEAYSKGKELIETIQKGQLGDVASLRRKIADLTEQLSMSSLK